MNLEIKTPKYVINKTIRFFINNDKIRETTMFYLYML